MAGFLSYLIPGLGQIYQGRIAKGLLFMVCLYGLFFYGMHLGSWKNVWIRDAGEKSAIGFLPRWAANAIDRLPFLGQLPLGVVIWPAILQYNDSPLIKKFPEKYRDFMKTPVDESELQRLQRDGDKYWDLGWVYTVIAGVLNILVIYDAFAGPAFAGQEEEKDKKKECPEEVATA